MTYSQFKDSKPCASGYAVGSKGSEVDVDIDKFIIQGVIDDVSTAGSYWTVSPYAGTIEKIYTVINGALGTASSTVTFEIDGSAIVGGTVTIAASSSAAGDVDSATPTSNNTVSAGQAIELITNGASSNTVKAEVTLICKRT